MQPGEAEVKVFDEAGRSALAEVGVASLLFNGAVEIEAIVEIQSPTFHQTLDR